MKICNTRKFCEMLWTHDLRLANSIYDIQGGSQSVNWGVYIHIYSCYARPWLIEEMVWKLELKSFSMFLFGPSS